MFKSDFQCLDLTIVIIIIQSFQSVNNFFDPVDLFEFGL